MSTIPINHGIPIPRARGGGRNPKYPFAQMAVGDMFYADTTARTLQSTSWAAGKRLGFVFRVQADAEGLVGCWRIA